MKNKQLTMTLPKDVKDIMHSLISHGYEAYVIGGAVRDIAMGVEPNDYDIFTNASGREILSIFQTGKVIGGEERQEKILTVVVKGIEVSQYRANGTRTETGTSLETHLETCDFNMNAMAVTVDGVISNEISGMSDIRAKVVDAVGNPHQRIKEDKLRAFRAIRFAVKYDFDIGVALMSVIRKTDINLLPVERIREEVLKILMYPGGLEKLKNSGLLGKVIPEFDAHHFLKGGNHHNETVDTHMEVAQSMACELTDNKALVFACALHDIGKATSFQIKEDGDILFHEHEKVGADVIKNITERFKFSNKDIKYITALVRHHLVNYGENTTDRAYVKRFKALEDAGVSVDDYMIMLYVDHQSNLRNKRIKFGDFITVNTILKKYNKLKYSDTPFDIASLDITGSDIMHLGVPMGPAIGATLDMLFDKVISGEIENKFHILIRYVKWGVA